MWGPHHGRVAHDLMSVLKIDADNVGLNLTAAGCAGLACPHSRRAGGGSRLTLERVGGGVGCVVRSLVTAVAGESGTECETLKARQKPSSAEPKRRRDNNHPTPALDFG